MASTPLGAATIKPRLPAMIIVIAGLVCLLAGRVAAGSIDSGDEQSLPVVQQANSDLSFYASAGLPTDAATYEKPQEGRNRVAQADRWASDPDPERRHSHHRASEERGEITCEAIPPFTDRAHLAGSRCVGVPTGPQSTLFVFLSPRGEALVIAMSTNGAVAYTRPIPELGEDLVDAGLSVRDDGTIVRSTPSSETDIDTSRW